MFDVVIEGIRELEAERTRYKDKVEAIEVILAKHPRQTIYTQVSRVVEDYSILMVDIEKALKGETG